MDLTVSAAIPCYNGAAYVGEAVESLLDQTRPADEIIVVDDGSSDDSVEIVKRRPVKLIQHELNKGLASARNTALAEAVGDILVFVDVDAMADPKLLEVLLSGYTSPNVVGVGGQGVETNINTLADRWRRVHASQGHGNRPKVVEHLYGLCMSYRVEVLRKIGGFNTAFLTNAEDVDVGLRLSKAGYQLRYLPEARVYHRRTDNEASLKATMAAWRVAGYHARRINNAGAWTLFLGTLRRMITDPMFDLLVEHEPGLARLSWQIAWVKLRALTLAARSKDR